MDAQIEDLVVKEDIQSGMQGGTFLSIATRLSSIREAGRIAVLEEEQFVDIGTFDELSNREDRAFRALMGRQLWQ